MSGTDRHTHTHTHTHTTQTPAMEVYNALMKTPEAERCAERRELTF